MTTSVATLFAQTATDSAALQKSVQEAIGLMDRNMPEQAIRVWDRVIQSVPDYTPYKYERAICLMMAEKYHDAQTALEAIYTDRSLFDRGYQLLGNCYVHLDSLDKAATIYHQGLASWPNSGRLHLELGNIAMMNRKPDDALDWWVRGTRAEPSYASTYYTICKTFAFTPHRFWAMLYGELFLNIESSTQRTAEISEMLFQIWQRGIRRGSEDPINLASEALLEQPSSLGPTVMNFPTAFEYTVATSLAALPKSNHKPDTSLLSVAQLVELRLLFIRAWKEAGYLEKYPNDVLNYHATLLAAGWLKEYLWWLYSYGNKKEMNDYYKSNEHRYDTFLGWFGLHSMDVKTPKCVGYKCP